MDTQAILAQLNEERDRIQQAINALQGMSGATKRPGPKPGTRRRRIMSADARRRIGLAMKKRWAERKKNAA